MLCCVINCACIDVIIGHEPLKCMSADNILQIMTVERIVFDTLGQMWGTMAMNCMTLLCTMTGIVGVCIHEKIGIGVVSLILHSLRHDATFTVYIHIIIIYMHEISLRVGYLLGIYSLECLNN